jgi:peptidoglycan endopeptidase LytF
MYLKRYSWQVAGLAATLLLNGCALLAPPGTGTEEDPYTRNTREYAPESGTTFPVPSDGYSSPSDTGYPPSNTGGYMPPATDVYIPPATGNYSPPAPTYYPPPSNGNTNYHTVRAGENLYRISKSYGLRYQEVAALNNIPPPYTVSVGQRLSIRGGSGAVAPSSPSGSASYHTVQAGENLYRVSLKYGCTVADLARWNGLSPADYSNLKVGQKLRIATGAFTPNRSVAATPNPVLKTVPITPSAPAPFNSGSGAAVPNSNFHVVGANESLAGIASSYGLTIYELALWNGISSPYTVYPGQRLLIVPP